MWNQNNDTTISGMTSEDFRQRLNKVLKESSFDIDNNHYPEGYQEAPLAYDAVWSVALGMNSNCYVKVPVIEELNFYHSSVFFVFEPQLSIKQWRS